MDKEFKLGARVIAYVAVWLIGAYALFRILVPMTWGAPWALAPVAAMALAIAGALALLYLLLVMFRDVRKAMQRLG